MAYVDLVLPRVSSLSRSNSGIRFENDHVTAKHRKFARPGAGV